MSTAERSRTSNAPIPDRRAPTHAKATKLPPVALTEAAPALDSATLARLTIALQAAAGNRAVQRIAQGALAAAPEAAAPTRAEMSPVTVREVRGQSPAADAVRKSVLKIHGVLLVGVDSILIVDELRKYGENAHLVARAYRQEHNADLRTNAITKLKKEDDLVRILSFLHSGRDDEPYAKLGLAIIPSSTRDAEVARIINNNVPLHTRRLTQAFYEQAFRGIGKTPNDTLPEHLQAAYTTGGEAYERALILLGRNLTVADELHLCTTARLGTDAAKAIEILQREWGRGFDAFSALVTQWEDLIHRPGLADLPLREAMTDTIGGELSGESKEIVEAIFTGYDAKTKMLGAMNAAAWEGGDPRQAPAAMAKDGSAAGAMLGAGGGNAAMVGSLPGATTTDVIVTGFEDIDLKVAEATFKAATTGGLTGAGTNTEQVMKSIDTMRKIWEARITHAKVAQDQNLVAQYTAQWALHREKIREVLQGGVGELSDLNADLIEAKLRLQGPLQAVDEIFIAKERYQDDKVLELVTKEWIAGREDSLRDRAEEPVPAGEEQVRPTYKLEEAMPQGRPLFWPTYAMYAVGHEHWERGANRLQLHLTGRWITSASKDLAAAYDFLQKLPADVRSSVIKAYVDKYIKPASKEGPPAPGEAKQGQGPKEGQKPGPAPGATGAAGAAVQPKTAEEQFVAYLLKEIEFSVAQRNMIELVQGPAETLEDHLMRAEIRLAAGKGYFKTLDTGLEAAAGLMDAATGEDTQELVYESMRSLRQMAHEARVSPAELDVMLALSGKENLSELGTLSYDQFKAHHDAARETRDTIVSALEQVIDVAGRSLLVVLFPPTVLGGLAAALGAFATGMVVREALQAADYTLFSVENLAVLLEEVATSAFDALGIEAVIQEMLSSQAVGALLRIKDTVKADQYAKMIQEVLKSSGSKLFEKTVSNAMLGQSLPTGEEMAARAINMLTLGGLKAGTMQLTKVMHAFTPTAERLTRNLASIVINGPPAKAALPTVLIKELASILTDPNFSHMTGPEIMGRLAKTGMSSVASAVSVSLAITRVQQVEAAKIKEVGKKAVNHRDLDDLVKSDPALAGPYKEYAEGQEKLGRPVLPGALWAKVAGRGLGADEVENELANDERFRQIAGEYVRKQGATGAEAADMWQWLPVRNKIEVDIPVMDHALRARRKIDHPDALQAAEEKNPTAGKKELNMDKALSTIYKQLADLEAK